MVSGARPLIIAIALLVISDELNNCFTALLIPSLNVLSSTLIIQNTPDEPDDISSLIISFFVFS